jgi:hypothetical protein
LQSLAGEPVDGTGDKLLLDVLSELVVKLEALLDVGRSIVLVLWGVGRVEEVEERLSRNSLLDDARLLGVCGLLACGDILEVSDYSLLFLCFLLSMRTVRSLPAFHSILSPSAWS